MKYVRRSGNRWMASIDLVNRVGNTRAHGHSVSVGTYDTETEAYNAAIEAKTLIKVNNPTAKAGGLW